MRLAFLCLTDWSEGIRVGLSKWAPSFPRTGSIASRMNYIGTPRTLCRDRGLVGRGLRSIQGWGERSPG
eukprot:5249118-Prymnesium_polylepis.1